VELLVDKRYLQAGVLLVLISLAGCRPGSESDPPPPLETAIQTPDLQETRTARRSEVGVTTQWAVSAEASSEFSVPEWAADKATGPPDSPGCGDYQFAWASAASDSIDTLVLDYATPVYPLELVIYESFNPDQVVKVEVFDPDVGGYFTVLQKNPLAVDRPCPYELVVFIEGIDFLTSRIRITVDQSQLGLGWNQIDAVELVGSISSP
jgi:hypothetical protein